MASLSGYKPRHTRRHSAALKRTLKVELIDMLIDQLQENEKLKEENEKLKILVQKYQDASLIHTDATPEEITEGMEEYEEVIEKMEEKIEELEEENEKLKDEACDYESMRKHRDTLLEESEEMFMKIHNLEEENEKLNEALKSSALEEDEHGFAVSDWFHEKLDKHIKFHLTEIGGEFNYIDTETGEHVFCLGSGGTLDDAVGYVEQLKEQNEKLKAGTLLKFQEVEIEDLTQENQNFKEILDEVREYLGRFDGDEVEVFDKIVKGE